MKTFLMSSKDNTTKFTFLSALTLICFLLAGLPTVFGQGTAFIEMEGLSVIAQDDAVAEELPVARQVMIENVETQRYLFCTGEAMTGNQGDEGGWLQSPAVVGSDANYYNRAVWSVQKNRDGSYYITDVTTNRYLFCTGEVFNGNRGDEGGWLQSPKVVGSDANYYNRAMWLLEKNSDGTYYIINKETHRYLFPSGDAIKGNRGDEGGWLQSPPVVGTDANYYNRAKWKIIEL